MNDERKDDPINTALKNWAKVALLILALGFVFGVDFATKFADNFLGFVGKIFIGCLIGLAIFGSIDWVFKKVENKSGNDVAVVMMFAYILVGLPLLAWVLDILFDMIRL